MNDVTLKLRGHLKRELMAPIVGKLQDDNEYWYLAGQCINFLARRYCVVEEVFLRDELLGFMMQHTTDTAIFSDAMFTFVIESRPYLRSTDCDFFSCYAMLITYDLEKREVNKEAILQGFRDRLVMAS